MAKRKTKQDIDIAVDETVRASAAEPVAAGQPEPPLEKALPELTVRIFPVRNPKSKLRATANVNIAGAFAVQGFRIFDSKNGLFVKEPERQYVKDGTQLSQSVFFPITREAREKLYGQILHSYEMVMDAGQTPQGNASLAGAVYRVSYQQGGEMIVREGTTDELGRVLPAFTRIPFGVISVQEIKAPEGYKLDTSVHTYTISPENPGVADFYEWEPEDLTEEVIRGGITIEKRDAVTGKTPQGDASFAGIKFDVVNDSDNPVVVNGKTCAPGSVAMTITTDAKGMATTGPNALPYGDYIIKESATNNSMQKTFDEEIPVTISGDGEMHTLTAENEVVRGGIAIEKQDSQTGAAPQGNADFLGITFEIVNRSANPVVVDGLDYAPGAVVATLTTDAEGRASTADDALPFGRYEVRESATNESMRLTFQPKTVTVSENKKMYPVTAKNDVVRGGLSLEKRDTITGSTPQGDADFAGITFQIINQSRNPVIVNGSSYAPGEVVLELTTDSEGKASTANDALPYGEYILHESATNESMLNTASDQQVIISEHHKVYPFIAENEVVRGGVLIEKRDLESGLLTPLGGASLDGTLFEITNKSRNAVYVDGALYEPESVCLTIEVKEGIAQSDVRALPYGTYSMVESKPGTGYLWTDKKVRDFTVREDGEVTEFREGDAAYNQVKRGDLRFVKVGEDNMHRFANVLFKLTSQTTGESHILVTDSNGEVRTETRWNSHSQNTNGNDDTEDYDDQAGTWFGLTTEGWIVETQDGLCALPFDHYTLQELRCPGNEGYELVTVPDISITRDSTVIELGTIDDKFEGKPEIGTTAAVDGEKLADPLGEVTLVDTVAYSGLTAGKSYKLSGVLMDKGTRKPLEIGGQQVTAEKEFSPKMCKKGIGTQADKGAAHGWYQQAYTGFLSIEKQFADDKLYYRLGHMNLTGKGMPVDIPQAALYFEKAAKLGNANAEYRLGKLFLYGKGVTQDQARAIAYLTSAAEHGNVYAAQLLQRFYEHDNGAVTACVLSLLQQTARIFEDRLQEYYVPQVGLTDRKLLRKIAEKKLAQGQKLGG